MRLLLWITIFSFLSGCAGFASNKSNGAFDHGPGSTRESKVRLLYKVKSDANIGFDSGPMSEKSLVGEFMAAVSNAGCCIVTTDEADADVKIQMTVLKYENPAAMVPAFITGFTFYVIPSWATTRYTFIANVIDSRNIEHNYHLEDSWTLVQWLPMLFVFPFFIPMTADAQTIDSLHEQFLMALRKDGLI